jgi:hypothetical protein
MSVMMPVSCRFMAMAEYCTVRNTWSDQFSVRSSVSTPTRSRLAQIVPSPNAKRGRGGQCPDLFLQ